MAQQPIPELIFSSGCGDCGHRVAKLPLPLPKLGDDFDWLVRDYDGFRLFMMEELSARFPERRRWSPADMEVVIVEALSVVLDQLSDMLDRTFAEAFLETARQPESVRRLLYFIGYDAIALADTKANIPDESAPISETETQMRARLSAFTVGLEKYIPVYLDVFNRLTPAQQNSVNTFILDPETATAQNLSHTQLFLDISPEMVERIQRDALHQYWYLYPRAMDEARKAGPRAVHTQRRMVTTTDYAKRLADHPLVLFANAKNDWSGSWSSIWASCLLFDGMSLDDAVADALSAKPETFANLQKQLDEFHRTNELIDIDWSGSPTARTLLRYYLNLYRMAGQEVFLADAEQVGINISLSIRISENYFQSEIQRAVFYTLGTGFGGFFEPGRLQFGQDVFASDIIEVVMALDGIEAVCLNRFKRVGKRYADQSDNGRIELAGNEVAVCNSTAGKPEEGQLRLTIHGGMRG